MRSTFPQACASALPISSFAPIEAPDARVLVLGTMPGRASLDQAAYYAHPRNAFWPLMLAGLTGEPLDFTSQRRWTYDQRIELLIRHRVALWDVLAECIRPGSLDAAIAMDSVRANDLATFVAGHGNLQRLIFNGKSAAKLYQRHAAASVAAVLEARERTLETIALPSTSPAMAAKTLSQKYALWYPAITLA